MRKVRFLSFAVVVFFLFNGSLVWALTLECKPTSSGSVAVDGLFGDWNKFAGRKISGKAGLVGKVEGQIPGQADLSLNVSCMYTDDHLYFRVIVSDDYIVRFKKLDFKQDHMMLVFKDGSKIRKMAFFPPDGRQKPSYGWVGYGRKRRRKRLELSKPKGVTATMIRLHEGYGLEMAMESDAVPGYGVGSSAMNMSVVVADVDSKAHPKVKARMGTGGMKAGNLGKIEFEGSKLLLASFLKDQGLSHSDIKMNRVGNIVSGKGLERVVIAKRILGVMGGDVPGGGYFYMRLPVHKHSHILRFALKDMNGDGQDEILLRLRQIKEGRGREIYTIYRYKNRALQMIFGHEVVHIYDDKVLSNKYKYIRRGKGYDLEFSVGKCVGFSKQNHTTGSPQDLQGLLTPWGGKKRVRYKFTSDSYVEVDS